MKYLIGREPRYSVKTRRDLMEAWNQSPELLDKPLCPICNGLLKEGQYSGMGLRENEYACERALCPSAGRILTITETRK